MPTYDYICDNCSHEFEAFESIKADPQTVCPACSEPKLRRKLGPGAAILFKGSGFYQTDYRSESYKKAAKADKSSSEGASKGGEAASKPAAESSGSTGSGGTSSSTPAAKPAAPSSST
jgi:putative FmdB family regulatory protein